MWLAPLITAVILGVFVISLHLWQQRREKNATRTYRARFVQLVAQLDTLTIGVTKLADLVGQVHEAKVLDYYESTLRLVETLLLAIRKIPPFGADLSSLDSAFFLVKDCRQRAGRIQQAFQDAAAGRPVRLDQLYGPKASTALPEGPQGCYFCSRPVVVSRSSHVKVKLDGSVREVLSCSVCRDELESTKKVKVLYFMKEGKPVHWSDVNDYVPSEDFWDINKREPIRRTTKLELVHSQHDPQPLS